MSILIFVRPLLGIDSSLRTIPKARITALVGANESWIENSYYKVYMAGDMGWAITQLYVKGGSGFSAANPYEGLKFGRYYLPRYVDYFDQRYCPNATMRFIEKNDYRIIIQAYGVLSNPNGEPGNCAYNVTYIGLADSPVIYVAVTLTWLKTTQSDVFLTLDAFFSTEVATHYAYVPPGTSEPVTGEYKSGEMYHLEDAGEPWFDVYNPETEEGVGVVVVTPTPAEYGTQGGHIAAWGAAWGSNTIAVHWYKMEGEPITFAAGEVMEATFALVVHRGDWSRVREEWRRLSSPPFLTVLKGVAGGYDDREHCTFVEALGNGTAEFTVKAGAYDREAILVRVDGLPADTEYTALYFKDPASGTYERLPFNPPVEVNPFDDSKHSVFAVYEAPAWSEWTFLMKPTDSPYVYIPKYMVTVFVNSTIDEKLANATVNVNLPNGTTLYSGLTSGDGTVSFNLEPGNYTVTASKTEYREASKEITVTTDTSIRLTLETITPPPTIPTTLIIGIAVAVVVVVLGLIMSRRR
jgi:hypothetical protein